MSIEEKINKLSGNEIKIPDRNNYSVILGLNPSKGARSPKLWNAAYSIFSIDSEMIPIDVTEENFKDLLSILDEDPAFSGGAIAAPHKESAAGHLIDNLTKEAKSIGAINCLYRNSNGTLCGTNTDGEGCLRAFEDTFGKIENKLILILGAGGTGKAASAYFAAAAGNLQRVYISSRSESALNLSRDIGCNSINWSEIDSLLPEVDILINCTSLGSILQPGLSPLNPDALNKLKSKAIVYDVIYDPNPTPLLEYADELGLKTLNGEQMNFEQAVLGFHYAASYGEMNFDFEKIRIAMK